MIEPAELKMATRRHAAEPDSELWPTGPKHAWIPYAVGVALIGGSVLIGEAWSQFIGERSLSLPFIIAIMLCGGWYGMRAALAAAIAAFLAYNFFLVEPRFIFTVSASDMLPLGSFFAAAVIAGVTAGRLSDRARAANDRALRLAALLRASRELSGAVSDQDVGAKLAEHLKRGGVEAAIWGAASGEPRLLATTDGAELGADGASASTADAGAEYTSLVTARGTVGAVSLWRREEPRDMERQWIEALLQLGAISLDRATLAAEVADARLVAEREGLRTALLSSVSHDLRTPIATILACASSLVEHQERFDARTRLEMVDTIQEQTERLHRYVSNLLEMTRLESGALALRRTLIDPAEAAASALQQSRRVLADKAVRRLFLAQGAMVSVDPILLEQALVNVIENAAAFSPDTGAISVTVRQEGEDVLIAVEDEGAGISAEDLPRVFDRFFRGNSDRARHGGTGLGLSVTRGIVEAFGGRVTAESPAKAGRGARLTIRLPAHRALETAEP